MLLSNLDTKNTTDNKTFYQPVKSFLSGKTLDSDQIPLIINNDEVISDDENIAKTFNDFFLNDGKSEFKNSRRKFAKLKPRLY